jgi:glucuronosyltransferase
MKLLLLISIILAPWSGESARILSVFQTPSKSHWILGHALLKELANSGHKVIDIIVNCNGVDLK